MTSLDARAQGTMTRQDFTDFVVKLAESRELDPESWPNGTLGEFLDGLSGWVADMDGYFAHRGEPLPSEPTWQLLAQMLLAARVYE